MFSNTIQVLCHQDSSTTKYSQPLRETTTNRKHALSFEREDSVKGQGHPLKTFKQFLGTKHHFKARIQLTFYSQH